MNLLNIDDMRKYIYNEETDIYYTYQIKEIIEKESIKITENINGIFINLSLLNNNIVKQLYNIIKGQKKKEDYLSDLNNESKVNIIPVCSHIEEPEIKEFKKIKLTLIQRKIIKSIL